MANMSSTLASFVAGVKHVEILALQTAVNIKGTFGKVPFLAIVVAQSQDSIFGITRCASTASILRVETAVVVKFAGQHS